MSVFYVINTIVNGIVKAELPDSAHQVTGIVFTTEKFPVVFYIKPPINIPGNVLSNYG